MDNPYPPATPELPVPSAPGSDRSAIPPPTAPPGGWAVGADRGLFWWKEGWRLFTAAPLIWIAILVLLFVLMFALALVPFIGQVVSTLLYPVLGAGVLVGTRELDRGRGLTIGHLFSCFNDKAIPLIVVALLYFGGWLVLWLVAVLVLVGVGGFEVLSAMMASDPMDAGVAMMSGIGTTALIVVLVVTMLGIPLIMAYWFAPALVVFHNDNPVNAMKSSFTASLRNIPPFLVYSLIGIVLAIIATIPFGLGWLVLAPVYGASLYPGYKDVFGEPT